jgi:hypothetical protein
VLRNKMDEMKKDTVKENERNGRRGKVSKENGRK